MVSFNASQRAAIGHAGGPACVLAGAGTGKTTVIAERFRHLVSRGVAPERILVLTFSRQAAEEMRVRITARLTGGYPRLSIGTFHSFCLEALTRIATDAGRAAPTVIADGARQALLAPLLGRIAPSYYVGARAREYLGDALTFIDRASDELVSPEDCRRLIDAFAAGALTDPDGSGGTISPERLGRLRDLAAAYELYVVELRQRDALDYGAMIARLVRLWQADGAALARARAAYDCILVDEFQDVNRAQFELVRMLAAPRNELMVVGDDAQAIYGFRGASDRFISRFRDFYPDAAVYDLTENYRSHQRILDAANAAIAFVGPAGGVRRLTSPMRPDGPHPVYAWFAGQAEEAAWIADRIAAGLAGEGGRPARRPRDYAVLCRSLDQLAQSLLLALSRRGIPARLTAHEPRREPAVADALAALAVINAFSIGQAPPAGAVLRILAAALPPDEFQPLAAAMRARGGLAGAASSAAMAGAAAGSIGFGEEEPGGGAGHLLAELKGLADLPAIDQVYGAIRLAARCAGDAGVAAWPALRDLAGAAETCLRAGGTLTEFLRDYQPPPLEPATADAVAVMTVHAAKGLQFPVVFIAGLADGVFPVATRLAPTFELAPLRAWLDGGEYRPRGEAERQSAQLREERRLFYVALTRAEDELYLTGAAAYGTSTCGESPFAVELVQANVVAPLAAPVPRPSLLTVVGEARAYLLDLAAGRPTGGAPGAVLRRGLAARTILAAGADVGATDLVPNEGAQPFRADQGLRTSVSALEIYARCPRQFFFEHCLRLPAEEALPMSFGNALHAVLAAFNRRRQAGRGLASEDEVVAWWRERLEPQAFASRRQYRQYLQRGEIYLRRYRAWEEAQERVHPGRAVRAVERPFAFAYVDADGVSHEFRGRFDLILEHQDGTLEIVDYKSGKRSVNKRSRGDSPNNPERSWQLAVYHLALSRELEAEGAAAIVTTYCFLAHPRDEFASPVETFDDGGENVITCCHGEDSLAVVRAELDEVLRGIRANRFPPQPRDQGMCERCQFRQLCEVGKHDYR